MNKYTSLILSLVLLILGIVWEKYLQNNTGVLNNYNQNLRIELDAIKQRQNSGLRNIEITKALISNNLEYPELLNYTNENIHFAIYKNNVPVFWTNNQLPIGLQELQQIKNDTIIKNKHGYFQVCLNKIGEFTELSFYKFYFQFPVNNAYFNDHFAPELAMDNLKYAQLFESDLDSTYYYSLVPTVELATNPNKINSKYVLILYLLSFLLFVYFSFVSNLKKEIFRIERFVFYLSFYLISFSILVYFDVVIKIKNQWYLFSPEMAAFNEYITSIGHLALVVFVFFILSVCLQLMVRTRIIKLRLYKNYYLPISVLSCLILGFIIIYCIPIVVNNSQINYSFSDFENINFFSILGLLCLFGLFLIYLLISRAMSAMVRHVFNKKWFILLHVNVCIFLSLLVFYYKIGNGFLMICASVVSVISCFFILFPKQLLAKHIIYYSILICAYLSVQFKQLNSSKEENYRKVYAGKFINKLYFETNDDLYNSENTFIGSNFGESLLTSSDSTLLMPTIKYHAFGNFMRNYDIELIKFDAQGKNLEVNKYSYSMLDGIYNDTLSKPASNYFLYINNSKLMGAYLAKFEICKPTKTIGYVFVLLIPKVKNIINENEHNFAHKTFNSIYSFKYSIALYKDNTLIKSIGKFPYKLSESENLYLLPDASFIEVNGYSHLVKKINNELSVLVTMPAANWRDNISLFCAILIICVGSLLLLFFIFYIVFLILGVFKSNKMINKIYLALLRKLRIIEIKNIYLQTKIQITFMLFVVFICTVIAYFTVLNVTKKFKNSQQESFHSKMEQIVAELELNYSNNLAQPISILLKHLSNTYQVEINFYNKDGILIDNGTTVNNDNWNNTFINANAFEKLNKHNEYSIRQTENVGNLTYQSYYTTIFNVSRQVEGYLNIPYFIQEIELKSEVSGYVGDIIDIMVLILIITYILANYAGAKLIKPLRIMAQSISNMKLGEDNKPIEWKQNDEIGHLVIQYNNMLAKLAINTEKLAQSEREGAWREMAKQVAHEIKNPLTPMKLHLQQLQRLMDRNDPNIVQQTKNVSNILIEQIDQLDKMANEFSSFAKMPTTNLEIYSVHDILQQSIDLFKAQSTVSIIYEPFREKYLVYVDKGQLQRVFTNLLKNAEQAASADESCEIIIKLEKELNFIVLSFCDNGTGVPEELISKIFMPNFSTKSSGMGIGLAICKKIMDSFDGKLYCRNNKDKGATFYIELPLYS